MMTEAEVQTEMKAIARDIEEIRLRLLTLRGELPVSPNERLIHVHEAEMDLTTELRAVIECVVHDDLDPAIRELRRTAESMTPIKPEEAQA